MRIGFSCKPLLCIFSYSIMIKHDILSWAAGGAWKNILFVTSRREQGKKLLNFWSSNMTQSVLLWQKYRSVIFCSSNTVYGLCSQSENFGHPTVPSTCLFRAHKLLTLKLVSFNNVCSFAQNIGLTLWKTLKFKHMSNLKVANYEICVHFPKIHFLQNDLEPSGLYFQL